MCPFCIVANPSGPFDRAAGSIALVSLRTARYVHFKEAAAGPQIQFNRKKQQTENKNIYPLYYIIKQQLCQANFSKKKKKKKKIIFPIILYHISFPLSTISFKLMKIYSDPFIFQEVRLNFALILAHFGRFVKHFKQQQRILLPHYLK